MASVPTWQRRLSCFRIVVWPLPLCHLALLMGGFYISFDEEGEKMDKVVLGIQKGK